LKAGIECCTPTAPLQVVANAWVMSAMISSWGKLSQERLQVWLLALLISSLSWHCGI
jgi:hypothetical protein